MPDVPTVAIEVEALLQVPPSVASLKAIVAPVHIMGKPVIGAGTGFTVTTVLTVPQEVV